MPRPEELAEDQESYLDSFITDHMVQHHIPGLAAAAVDSGRVVWIGAYGLADVEREIQVTAETPFQVASACKPITATILLTAYAEGRFSLDDDIGSYLPFPVRHPKYPDLPITFRQLLRHESGIVDNTEYYGPLWTNPSGDPTTSLGQHLKEYLTAGGANYDAVANFSTEPPGEAVLYSNTGYALLGYLGQCVSSMPFEQLSHEVLFSPLGMGDTAWFLSDLDSCPPAIPYTHDPDSGFVVHPHNGYPDWPAGQLRSSARDMARFLAVYTSGGTHDSQPVINERIIELLSPRTLHSGFHTWGLGALRNRQILYIHQGGDLGVRSAMGFHQSEARGVVVLANGEGSVLEVFEEVYLAIDTLK
jgi:CubicO group peptidase (beta-lactamase class C family)